MARVVLLDADDDPIDDYAFASELVYRSGGVLRLDDSWLSSYQSAWIPQAIALSDASIPGEKYHSGGARKAEKSSEPTRCDKERAVLRSMAAAASDTCWSFSVRRYFKAKGKQGAVLNVAHWSGGVSHYFDVKITLGADEAMSDEINDAKRKIKDILKGTHG